MLSVAAGSRDVQATSVPRSLSSSLSADEREGASGSWREEVRRWREELEGASSPGLSSGAYLHAGTLRASGGVLEHRVSFGLWEAPVGGRRGEVQCWTVASRRRLRVALRRVNWGRHAPQWCVVTLTLPGKDTEICMDGRQVHRWRRAFLERWRREYGLRSYAWKLEFQRRGAAHFAVVLPFPLVAIASPSLGLASVQAWVARAWFEVVGSGSQAHLQAGTQTALIRDLRTLSSYIVGEVVKGRKSKEYQHVVPSEYRNVGRWWGLSRGMCEPWSEFGQGERQAYATRRILREIVRSPRYAGVVRRSMRKRVSSMTVFPREDALLLAWRIRGLRL